MKSHVQIPKFILKNFVSTDVEGKSWTLDLKDHSIKSLGPKEIGVVDNYYDSNTESKLSHSVEYPFSIIANEIISQKGNYVFCKVKKAYIAKFFFYLFKRQPLFQQEVQKTSIRGQEDDITPSKIVNTKTTNMWGNWFDNHDPVILVNATSKKFISSTKGLGFYWEDKILNNVNWVLPISPEYSILLVNESLYKCFGKSKYDIIDLKEVEYYNDIVIKSIKGELTKTETPKYKYCLISKYKDELLKIKNKYN